MKDFILGVVVGVLAGSIVVFTAINYRFRQIERAAVTETTSRIHAPGRLANEPEHIQSEELK